MKTSMFPDAECDGPPRNCKGGHHCSVNAECIDNGDSSYRCKCKDGYNGNGLVCTRGNYNIAVAIITVSKKSMHMRSCTSTSV